MKDPKIDEPCGSPTQRILEATAIATAPCHCGPTNRQDPAS